VSLRTANANVLVSACNIMLSKALLQQTESLMSQMSKINGPHSLFLLRFS